MDNIPEDPPAREAFLERWATEQRKRLYADEIARVLARGREIARMVAQGQQGTGQVDALGEVAAIPVVITRPSDLPVDRAAVFADLRLGLREYKWADPIVSQCDDPGYIASNAIDLARRHRPDAPWLLYMEDDVILGPDFGSLPELLRKADALFPHTGIVSFFSASLDEPGWSIHPMEEFGWLQCAAIRNTEYLAGFRAFIDYVTQTADKQMIMQLPDGAVQALLATEYDTYAVWCPSLVQHAEVTSALWRSLGAPNHVNKMISKSYERAYGQT